MSTSMWGNAFLSLFFMSRLPIPLLLRSRSLIVLLVLRHPTIPSTAFSVILFPYRSSYSIWVSHTALTTWPIPSSVMRFLASDSFLRWFPYCGARKHFAKSAECMSERSIGKDTSYWFSLLRFERSSSPEGEVRVLNSVARSAGFFFGGCRRVLGLIRFEEGCWEF